MQAERVIVHFIDKLKETFNYETLGGGDPIQVNIENPFIVITDTFHKVNYYPSDTIINVEVTPLRRQ